MLSELNIKNFAIIDELKVIFGHGLNVISGETGAGKSILIGAVSLILGDKASVEQIRTSEDAATVEALFTTAGHQKLREKLVSFGFEPDEDLIIRRTISRSGKGEGIYQRSIGQPGDPFVLGRDAHQYMRAARA